MGVILLPHTFSTLKNQSWAHSRTSSQLGELRGWRWTLIRLGDQVLGAMSFDAPVLGRLGPWELVRHTAKRSGPGDDGAGYSNSRANGPSRACEPAAITNSVWGVASVLVDTNADIKCF